MDGRRRQSNSGPASTAPIVTPYYSGSQPLTPVSDSGSGFSPRERFWTNSSNGRPPSPDPWTSSGYISQLLPPPCAEGMTPNYSPASHHSLNNNHSPPGGSTFALNIPSHSPYPPPSGGHNGNTASGNGGTAALMNLVNGNSVSSGSSDMSSSSPFSGPSPPNQAIPLSSPYGAPPTSNSPRRQYTPSTTPSPHVAPHQPNLNGMNGSSSHSHDNSPNSGNGAFHGYINGNLEPGGGPLSKGGGASDQGHPNDVPGYLPHPHSHQSQHSGRYPGEGKVSEGEMLHQYHHQQSYYHQNYAPYSQQQNQVYYDSYHGQGGGRRPFDPYQPYPTNHQSPLYDSSSYTTESSQNSQQQYNSKSNSRALSNSSAGPGNSRLKNSPENGPGKIEPCESLCEVGGGQNKEGYEDDPNFEAVLQGHMSNYGSMDHHHRGGGGFGGAPYGQAPSYDHDRHSEEANFPRPPRSSTLEKNQSQESHQSQESSKSDDSTNSSKQVPPKKEKVKKKRSRGIRQLTENSGIHGKKGEGGDGSGNSPKTTSRTEPDLGCSERLLDERSNSSSSANFPFADNVGGANTSPGTTATAGSAGPVSNAGTTSEATKKKKKSWKKTTTTKPINSEQLLEERERHCAQYVESTERVLNKDGKTVGSKVKEEGFYQHHSYEERNITIDHQKESEVVPKKEIVDEKSTNSQQSENSSHATTDEDDGKKEVSKKDVPMVECGCFPVDEVHPEPGPFYTHLGAAHTLPELREVLEIRTGFRGVQLRFEKVIYTGKEGKTSQGCPLAKWIIRRGSYEEQLLFLVKHRKGHKCATAWIVVCCVIWEAVPPHFADNLYDTLVYKLNRFGIPTTRRSDTNEQRSCACQGVDPDTCGAAYSFGCAWSMFFNGCKYARSRNVRKFRLTEEHEEAELEEKVSHLATHLGPLYERVAPDSYKNQIEHENEGLECRLGYRPGRPFSGVTACVDYCSHAHKDAHNMINGCTVTVAFTRNRSIAKGDDEQYHVLPLYKLDDTDELGSKEGQKQKIKKGQLEILKKFPSKIRVRKVPLLPSRRRGKVKPPSGSSSSSHHHHHHQPKGNDLYSAEHGSLAMPPPMKREKLSIFEELNGPSGGSDLFDTRFHHPAPPAPFNPDGLWNHPSAYAPSSSGHGQQTGAPFRTYFDPTSMIPPPTSLATPTSQYAPSAVQFGHSLDFNLSSSRSTGPSSSAMQNPGTTTSPSQSSGSGGPNNSNNGGGSGSGGSAPSNMTTPGYTSLSPSILPSFRHTFMTEAESLSMLSAMASPAPTGGPGSSSPMVENSSSSRSSGKGSTTPGSSSSTPAQNSSSPGVAASASSGSFNHQEALGFANSSSGYFGSSSSSSGNTPPYSASSSSSLYHPQAQHASPASCLSSPPSQGGGAGVSFNSSSYSPGSSFAPPGSMDPHHPGPFPGIPPINPWNPNVNTPPGYPHSAYGGSQTSNPYHHSHQHQMTSALNMNSMSPSHFQHMNQYSPYGNQPNFMSPSSMAAAAVAGMHSHHHPANPWANPLPTFGSHLTSHHAPPPPSCFVAPPKPKVIPEVNETYSDNEEAFKDPQLGGVAIAMTHGSVILQCAKHEMHATTSLKAPNRLYPSRICLVFYQHKSMNNRFHGWSEWEKKIEAKKLQEVKLINQGKLEASPRKMKQLIKEGYIADNP